MQKYDTTKTATCGDYKAYLPWVRKSIPMGISMGVGIPTGFPWVWHGYGD